MNWCHPGRPHDAINWPGCWRSSVAKGGGLLQLSQRQPYRKPLSPVDPHLLGTTATTGLSIGRRFDVTAQKEDAALRSVGMDRISAPRLLFGGSRQLHHPEKSIMERDLASQGTCFGTMGSIIRMSSYAASHVGEVKEVA